MDGVGGGVGGPLDTILESDYEEVDELDDPHTHAPHAGLDHDDGGGDPRRVTRVQQLENDLRLAGEIGACFVRAPQILFVTSNVELNCLRGEMAGRPGPYTHAPRNERDQRRMTRVYHLENVHDSPRRLIGVRGTMRSWGAPIILFFCCNIHTHSDAHTHTLHSPQRRG